MKVTKKTSQEEDYTFWTKYKRFATNELLLYGIMVLGIALGIILVGLFY